MCDQLIETGLFLINMRQLSARHQPGLVRPAVALHVHQRGVVADTQPERVPDGAAVVGLARWRVEGSVSRVRKVVAFAGEAGRIGPRLRRPHALLGKGRPVVRHGLIERWQQLPPCGARQGLRRAGRVEKRGAKSSRNFWPALRSGS